LVDFNKNIRVAQDPYSEPTETAGYSESLFQIAWRGRWWILLSVLLCLGAGFSYIFKATPIYTSTSRVYVEQGGLKIITQTEGIMTQSKNYLYTQAELLKSTPIITDCLAKPGIKKMKTFQFYKVDNHLAFLKKKLDVSVGKKDDIISVEFDSPYPAEAAELINKIVDSYITYHATQKKSTSAEILNILQKEQVKRREEITRKLKALMDFKKKNVSLAFESSRGNIILDNLARLTDAFTRSQLETLDAKTVYEITKEIAKDPVRLKEFVETQRSSYYSYSNTERTRLTAELETLELKLKDLLGRQLTVNHPSVKVVNDKIGSVKQQIARHDSKFASSQVAIAQQQYLAAKEKENLIREYLEEQRAEAITLNEQMSQYTLLQSDFEQTQKLSEILDDRIKELNVTEDTGALNISILEVARPEEKPSSPQKARIMAMALVLGMMLGCGIAILISMLDHRLRSAEEISEVMGVPVLGVIPAMSKRLSISDRGRKVHLDSASSVSEAYRTVRTSLFFGVPKGKAKTVLVTSPSPGDGKTTMVSNLSITMAQAGQRTLVIDADFRKPRQHEVFQLTNDRGLSNVVSGILNFEQAVQSAGLENLDILTCGPAVPNPSEILNSEAFSGLIEDFKKSYDRIIIDSPPVMPVTDAQILGAVCDVTIIMLRAEKSTRKTSLQAMDGLTSVGARILGAVVNDVSKRNGRYGYYGHYKYSYYDEKRRVKTD